MPHTPGRRAQFLLAISALGAMLPLSLAATTPVSGQQPARAQIPRGGESVIWTRPDAQ